MLRRAETAVSEKPRTVRVGAVSYLNSKPLVEGLTMSRDQVDLVLDYPSHLADDLSNGTLDVALVPSIEFLRNPDYVAVSDACVATHGAVLSVKLYSRVPIGRIRTLAVDAGSRTSVALTRVMLAEGYGVDPVLTPLPFGQTVAETGTDAVLLIGDRAIRPPQETFEQVWDLGQRWTEWTGLPFVFALWVSRPECQQLSMLEQILTAARDRGVSRLTEIAARESTRLGLSAQTAEEYLRRNLHFTLGAAEYRGLKLFYQLASQQGLVPRGNRLAFLHHPSAR